MHGTYTEHARNMHGTCTEYVRNKHGICTEHTRNMHGTYINDSAPTLDGYSAFSHNRTQIHKRAKVGSGGVSLLIKNEIVESYNL